MRWASSVSQFPAWDRACDEAEALLRERLDGAAPDLLLAFFSGHHQAAWRKMGERLRAALPDALLLGCTAHSVIGAGREVEEGPGVALVGALLPGVRIHPFHLAEERLPDLALPAETHFLLLADPFSSDVEALAADLDERFPMGQKIGGLASAGAAPGGNLLFLGDGAAPHGVAGVALSGSLRVETLVAQGCRPIGSPLFVTRAEANVLQEVDGRPPMHVLNELFARADAREQQLFRHSLFLGIEMRPARSEYGAGDFLIRNLLGADPRSGVVHVAAPLRERQVVQFHLRDARAADEDLQRHLAVHAQGGTTPPAGALLFSCLGRGRGLYGVPDHDCTALRSRLGDVPIGGFFCNGEIGPVQGRTFLHGYTSAFGLFRRPDPGPH